MDCRPDKLTITEPMTGSFCRRLRVCQPIQQGSTCHACDDRPIVHTGYNGIVDRAPIPKDLSGFHIDSLDDHTRKIDSHANINKDQQIGPG
ncbi:MAG: hypothetical protein C4293_17375 [Nitrospiraceae bacterium]